MMPLLRILKMIRSVFSSPSPGYSSDIRRGRLPANLNDSSQSTRAKPAQAKCRRSTK